MLLRQQIYVTPVYLHVCGEEGSPFCFGDARDGGEVIELMNVDNRICVGGGEGRGRGKKGKSGIVLVTGGTLSD